MNIKEALTFLQSEENFDTSFKNIISFKSNDGLLHGAPECSRGQELTGTLLNAEEVLTSTLCSGIKCRNAFVFRTDVKAIRKESFNVTNVAKVIEEQNVYLQKILTIPFSEITAILFGMHNNVYDKFIFQYQNSDSFHASIDPYNKNYAEVRKELKEKTRKYLESDEIENDLKKECLRKLTPILKEARKLHTNLNTERLKDFDALVKETLNDYLTTDKTVITLKSKGRFHSTKDSPAHENLMRVVETLYFHKKGFFAKMPLVVFEVVRKSLHLENCVIVKENEITDTILETMTVFYKGDVETKLPELFVLARDV